MKCKTIFIFDCDGTILNSFDSSQEILKRLAKQYKISLPNSNDLSFKKIWGKGGYNLIKRYFPKENPEIVHREWKKLESNIATNLIDGAETTIKNLKKRGFIVGLLTNRAWKSLKQYSGLIKNLNFDFIQTSEYKKRDRIITKLNPFKKHLTTSHPKPDSKCFNPFFKWMKRKKIKPKKNFYIGDCLGDFDAVINANFYYGYNIEFISVLTGPIKTRKNWYKITKTNKRIFILSSISALIKWLDDKKGDEKNHLL